MTPEEVSMDKLLEYKKEVEDSTGKTYRYIIWTNCVGYHQAYDLEDNEPIYIGSLSESRAFKTIKEYEQDLSIE